MSDIGDTPITEEAWQNADPKKHKLKDKYGRLWSILRDVGPVSLGYALMVQCPGHPPEQLIMTTTFGGRHIVEEEEKAIMLEFHAEGVELVEV